jgi:hypothetical protein
MWSTSFLLKINSPRLYDQLNSFLKSLAFAHMVNLIIFRSQLPPLIRPIQLFSQTNSPAYTADLFLFRNVSLYSFIGIISHVNINFTMTLL